MTPTALVFLLLLLCLYWGRYTCLLIRRGRALHGSLSSVARSNRLAYPAVQSALSGVLVVPSLDSLRLDLEQDWAVLTYLLRHASQYEQARRAPEIRLLLLELWGMRVWFRLMSRLSPAQARRALQEMADIIEHVAFTMGEQAAVAR